MEGDEADAARPSLSHNTSKHETAHTPQVKKMAGWFLDHKKRAQEEHTELIDDPEAKNAS